MKHKKILQKALRNLFDKRSTLQVECKEIINIWEELNLSKEGLEELKNDYKINF
jgi:hypothetical protein